MDVRLLFPSLYLGAPDLRGKDVTLTISRLQVDTLKTDKGDEKKPVIYFEETAAKARKAGSPDKEKRLVLNKTNMRSIAALYGFEANDWVGKRIVLYATRDRAFGKIVDCIRVREQAPIDAEPEEQQPQPETQEQSL